METVLAGRLHLSGRDLKKCVELKRVCLRYAYKSAMNYY